MITRDDMLRWAENVNPAPCDPDICGITSIPCPRCQREECEMWIRQQLEQYGLTANKDAQNLAEKQRLELWKKQREKK